MERTVRARAVRIKQGRTSAFRKFWRRHPYLYSIAATIAAFAVITMAVTLIQDAANSISGGSNPPPPVVAPPVPAPPTVDTSTQPESDPSTPPSTASTPATTPPAPPTVVPPPITTAPEPPPAPTPYSEGQCLAGDFGSSTPTDVQQVPCSSEDAYEILASYPGDSESVCEDVQGAELAYIQEELEDGVVVSSYVDCLGRPVSQ